MRGAFVGMMILFTRDIFLCIHSAFQRLVDRAIHYVGKFLLSDQTHAYDVHRLPSIGSSRRLSRHLLLLLWIYITAFFKIHSFPLRRLICCRLLKCFVWLWWPVVDDKLVSCVHEIKASFWSLFHHSIHVLIHVLHMLCLGNAWRGLSEIGLLLLLIIIILFLILNTLFMLFTLKPCRRCWQIVH